MVNEFWLYSAAFYSLFSVVRGHLVRKTFRHSDGWNDYVLPAHLSGGLLQWVVGIPL